MTIAYWCLLVILLFPYLFTVLAKSTAHFNNRDPRKYLENLQGWRRRAHYIQLNCFEINPAFGLALIVAHLAQSNQTKIDTLALIFVFSRISYALCYITDKASLRSLFWFIGMICVVGLFFIA